LPDKKDATVKPNGCLARPWLVPVALSVAVAASGGAKAQEQRLCANATDNLLAKELIDRTFHRGGTDTAAPVLLVAEAANPLGNAPAKPGEGNGAVPGTEKVRAAGGGMITVTLQRQGVAADPWTSSYVYAAAETAPPDTQHGTSPSAVATAPVAAFLRERSPTQMTLAVTVPENVVGFSFEPWRIVTVVCDSEHHNILGYGVVNVVVTGPGLAWALTTGGLVVFWTLITLATWQLNAQKLQRLWLMAHHKSGDDCTQWPVTAASGKELGPSSAPVRKLGDLFLPGAAHRVGWKLLRAANPLFIAQDSLGYGSLSRLQILIFTTVVGVVLLNIFIHSGVLASMSDTILTLLGLTVAGGTLASAANDWSGISARSRRLLFGKELLTVRRDKPKFSDTLETQGEVDVSKVQALLFTGLVAISILVNGVGGLGAFELPSQIVWLTGISQGAYVFGKLLPADTRKRLERDLEQLRTAAANLLSAREAARGADAAVGPQAAAALAQAQSAFEQAKSAATSTLCETYLDRFNAEKFKALEPEEV
jgi:hypothetical protein